MEMKKENQIACDLKILANELYRISAIPMDGSDQDFEKGMEKVKLLVQSYEEVKIINIKIG